MVQSGVSVHPDCVRLFNELKLLNDIKWIIYKFSDDGKEIVVEESSKDPDWSGFREKLLQAKSKDARGNEVLGGRYAVFDVECDLPSGDGKRRKIAFITWCPNDAGQYPRMLYASSKNAIKGALNGIASDIQANDADEIEHENIVSKVSKGR